MSQGLEKFVQQHREEMDAFEPGPVVWNNISRELAKPKQQEGIVISMRFIRRAVAAIIIIAAGASAWYLMRPGHAVPKPEVAQNTPQAAPKQEEQPVTTPGATTMPDNSPAPTQHEGLAKKDEKVLPDDDANAELVHYTELVAIKQRQLSKIKTEEPLLYRQFAGDFKKLDSTYHILKQQLPVNPNREQILEAMIQNLQYQEALLTQQLNVIKKIKHAKKEAYEKAYQSI